MSLVEHAKYELERAGLFDKDSDYDGELGKAALNLVKLFAKQGHSGASASITTSIVEKLMRYEPLTALTGEEDEWFDVSEMSGEPMWQNKRCSRVFRDKYGKAYDIEGRVFRDPDGSTWTNSESRVRVTFPYTPTREYVERAI